MLLYLGDESHAGIRAHVHGGQDRYDDKEPGGGAGRVHSLDQTVLLRQKKKQSAAWLVKTGGFKRQLLRRNTRQTMLKATCSSSTAYHVFVLRPVAKMHVTTCQKRLSIPHLYRWEFAPCNKPFCSTSPYFSSQVMLSRLSQPLEPTFIYIYKNKTVLTADQFIRLIIITYLIASFLVYSTVGAQIIHDVFYVSS